MTNDAARRSADTQLLLILREFWADALGQPLDAVSGDTDLFAEGADSMDAVYLETRIEEYLGLVLPEHACIEAPTPCEMEELISECRQCPLRDPGRVRNGVLVCFPGGSPGLAPLVTAIPGGVPKAGWLARHLGGPRGLAVIDPLLPAPVDSSGYLLWYLGLCDECVASIAGIDPSGPWRLMAVCGMGQFMWDIGWRLAQRGAVSMLLFDPLFGVEPDPGGADRGINLDNLQADPTPARRADPPIRHADIDLTLLLTPGWSHRPLCERYAEFTSRPAEIRYLPTSVAGHAVTAASIPALTAEIELWLASRDAAFGTRRPPSGATGIVATGQAGVGS